MKTKINELTHFQYNSLLNSGLFFEIYPEATGIYGKDIGENFVIPKIFKDKIKIKLLNNKYLCSFKNNWSMLWEELEPYIDQYKNGYRMGGTTFLVQRGDSKQEAYDQFYSRIKNRYLVKEIINEYNHCKHKIYYVD